MLEQNTNEWLEYRKNKIGASDAPIVMGISPWKTPYKLWREKLSLDMDNIETSWMSRGKDLEPIARKCFENQIGIKVNPEIMIHQSREWMMASLDGISEDKKTIVEIKCPGPNDHQIALNGKIPEKYWPQLQHQLEVCELDYGYYFSFDGEKGHIIKVYRDDSFIKNMILKEAEFWECMQTLTPPKSPENDFVIREDEAFCKAALHLRQVMTKRKELEKEELEMRNYLIQLSEGHNCKGMGISLSKVVRKGSIDYSLVEELKGIDLEKYRKPNIEAWRVV